MNSFGNALYHVGVEKVNKASVLSNRKIGIYDFIIFQTIFPYTLVILNSYLELKVGNIYNFLGYVKEKHFFTKLCRFWKINYFENKLVCIFLFSNQREIKFKCWKF